jgi:hypothetical protein
MTLIAGCAGNRVAAGTDPALARVGCGAGIAIVARGAVWLDGIRADSCSRIAGPCYVTLIERAADNRWTGFADATLASITNGTLAIVSVA